MSEPSPDPPATGRSPSARDPGQDQSPDGPPRRPGLGHTWILGRAHSGFNGVRWPVLTAVHLLVSPGLGSLLSGPPTAGGSRRSIWDRARPLVRTAPEAHTPPGSIRSRRTDPGPPRPAGRCCEGTAGSAPPASWWDGSGKLPVGA